MIPKIIYSVWFSEKKMPDFIKRCLDSQHLDGYEHVLLGYDNYQKSEYVDLALKAGKFCKVSDYLRSYYLNETGGIYLDADVEVLKGKNFDHLLDEKLFAAREENMFVNSAVMGGEKGHIAFGKYLEQVNKKFKGDDEFVFQAGVELITPILYEHAKILTPDYFFPYNHQKGTIYITHNTICYHHFMKSWV